MMIEFIKVRLKREDINSGWILESYPRTAFQAEELDFLLDTEVGV
jgi:adenylate kinase